MFFIYYFLFLGNQCSSKSNNDEYLNIITNPFINRLDSYHLKVSFKETFEEPLLIPIDLQDKYSYLPILPQEIHKSRKIRDKKIKFLFNEFECSEYEIDFYSSNMVFQCVILITKDFFPPRELNKKFTFSLLLEDTSYSIVYQMYKIGKIKNLSFGFFPSAKPNVNGEMLFGGLPASLTNGKHIFSCEVGKNATGWSCPLNKIIIGNWDRIYEVNDDAYFQISEGDIFVPRSFMFFLKDHCYSDYLRREKCIFYPMNNKIECKCNVIQNLPSFTFIINEYEFNFKAEDLFKKYYDTCELLFTPNTKSNQWIFGTSFLKYFISNFEYEKKRISLYSEKPIFFLLNKNYSLILKFFLFLIIKNGLMSMFLLYILKFR